MNNDDIKDYKIDLIKQTMDTNYKSSFTMNKSLEELDEIFDNHNLKFKEDLYEIILNHQEEI